MASETLQVFSFAKGMDSTTPLDRLPFDASPICRNVLLLADGSLSKRRGSALGASSIRPGNAYSACTITHGRTYGRGDLGPLVADPALKAWDLTPALVHWSRLNCTVTRAANSNNAVLAPTAAWGCVFAAVGLQFAAKFGRPHPNFGTTATAVPLARMDFNVKYSITLTGTAGKKFRITIGPLNDVIKEGTMSGASETFSGNTIWTYAAPEYTGYGVNLFIHGEDNATTITISTSSFLAQVASSDNYEEVVLSGSNSTTLFLLSGYAGMGSAVLSPYHGASKSSALIAGSAVLPVYCRNSAIGSSCLMAINHLALCALPGNVTYGSSYSTYRGPEAWNDALTSTTPKLGFDPPRYLATLRNGAGERLLALGNDAYPSRLWYSRMGDIMQWTDLEHPGPYAPGVYDVSDGDAPTGVAALSFIFVTRRRESFVLVFDSIGPKQAARFDLGCSYNEAIVCAQDHIFFINKRGAFVVVQNGDSFGLQRISEPIQYEFNRVDFTSKHVGFYHEYENKIVWWVKYKGAYCMFEYSLGLNAWTISSYSHADTQITAPCNADYSTNNNWGHLFNGMSSFGTTDYGCWQVYKDTVVNDSKITSATSDRAIDFSWKTAILHMGDTEAAKLFHELTVYYNGLSSASSYPFTIIIDRNPLENDDTVLSNERYIRIRDTIDVGDGTTYVTGRASGFSVGDIAGTAIAWFTNHPTTLNRKRYRFSDFIGSCKAIQIEFADARTGTDFVINGWALRYSRVYEIGKSTELAG